MTQLFESCRAIPAEEIAHREGIDLHQKGSRFWACCPLHGEDTASLMFDEAGRWYCFGCNRGGDAVDLYAAMHHITPYEAAQVLSQGYDVISCAETMPVPPAKELQNAVEGWYLQEWHRACKLKHSATALIRAADKEYDDRAQQGRPYTPPSSFYKWQAAKSAAECRLEELQLADIYDKIAMMVEESHEHT